MSIQHSHEGENDTFWYKRRFASVPLDAVLTYLLEMLPSETGFAQTICIWQSEKVK